MITDKLADKIGHTGAGYVIGVVTIISIVFICYAVMHYPVYVASVMLFLFAGICLHFLNKSLAIEDNSDESEEDEISK